MSDERPDKCPTCGIAREHDGPHYRKALKQAGKPMCPDPFHDPAPEPQGLDAVSGDGTWDEADERYAAAMNGEPHIPLEVANRRLREVERELQKCKRRRESWKAQASKYRQRLDIAHTRCDAALSELARTKRQLNTLREALETICEIGETRDVEVARAALASLDEQKGDE